MVAAVLLCLGVGCRRNQNVPVAVDQPLVESIKSGPIELTVIADPPQVHLDRDILLTLRVCAPSNMEVRLPSLKDRLKGFVLNGEFTRDGTSGAGKPVKEYCFRLTPTLADEYRIAPMAITWINRGQTPPADPSAIAGGAPFLRPPEQASRRRAAEGWFASRPIILQAVAVTKGPAGAAIQDIAAPVWIYPSFKTVALWALSIICAAGAVYLLWRISRRIHRAIKLRRMSPKERALYELNELLARDFIGKGKIKEFYLELTMVVRRYIERAHAIRAPEQTTEEFLGAAAKNPEFSREVVLKLRIFLQTADLVKFAAYCPAQEIIDQTLATARDYIDRDEQDQHEANEN